MLYRPDIHLPKAEAKDFFINITFFYSGSFCVEFLQNSDLYKVINLYIKYEA